MSARPVGRAPVVVVTRSDSGRQRSIDCEGIARLLPAGRDYAQSKEKRIWFNMPSKSVVTFEDN